MFNSIRLTLFRAFCLLLFLHVLGLACYKPQCTPCKLSTYQGKPIKPDNVPGIGKEDSDFIKEVTKKGGLGVPILSLTSSATLARSTNNQNTCPALNLIGHLGILHGVSAALFEQLRLA